VLLTDAIALNFKSSNLVRDVFPIIEDWKRSGADLAFTMKEFEETFSVVSDLELQFATFDTDKNGVIDAHEVLMVYILLSTGEKLVKVDTVFSCFNFPGGRNVPKNTLNFDEASMLVTACVDSLSKVCDLDFAVKIDEQTFCTKSMFDMFHLSYDERISRQQFQDWCSRDPAPRSFIELFHTAQGLPDIYSQVQQKNAQQGIVFQMLARGKLSLRPQDLLKSTHFRRVIGNPDDNELQLLTELMVTDFNSEHPGEVTSDKYHMVLRPWNIFNECDLNGTCALDDKEMEVLLWIQMRKKPSRLFTREFIRSIDSDDNGEVSRKEWIEAILEGEKRRVIPPSASDSEDSDGERLTSKQAGETDKQYEERHRQHKMQSRLKRAKCLNHGDTQQLQFDQLVAAG